MGKLQGKIDYWLKVAVSPSLGMVGRSIRLIPTIWPTRTVMKKARARMNKPIRALTIVPRALPIASLSPPEVIHLKAPITK